MFGRLLQCCCRKPADLLIELSVKLDLDFGSFDASITNVFWRVALGG